MNTISDDSSGHAASSRNELFQKSKQRERIAVLITWATRLIVIHTLLLSALPYVATAGAFSESWSSETGLLVLFLAGPLVSFVLLTYGSRRIGSILFLSVMPASAFTHVQFLVPWLTSDRLSTLGTYPFLYLSLLVVLTLTDLAASYVAFSILRAVHEMPAHETPA